LFNQNCQKNSRLRIAYPKCFEATKLLLKNKRIYTMVKWMEERLRRALNPNPRMSWSMSYDPSRKTSGERASPAGSEYLDLATGSPDTGFSSGQNSPRKSGYASPVSPDPDLNPEEAVARELRLMRLNSSSEWRKRSGSWP
jgi:hypothetical protein